MNEPSSSPTGTETTTALSVAPPTAAKPTRAYRSLIVVAILYTAWLIWLLYVGLVNYQAGNQ